MPKKQPIAKSNVTSAAPARVAKPRNSRVTTAKHSKAQAIEPSVAEPAFAEPASVEPAVVQPALVQPAEADVSVSRIEIVVPSAEEAREAIAKIAHSYWEARGGRDGSAEEDWVRAEAEYLSRSTAK